MHNISNRICHEGLVTPNSSRQNGGSSIWFFLTINYHFHLKNIKLFRILHSTCDIHLLPSKSESYL